MRVFHAGFSPGIPPARVRIGAGARHDLAPDLDALGIARALVLTTPQQARQGEALAAALGPRAAGVFAGAVMHTPVEVTGTAMAALAASGADGLIALGGGSTIGLGKALALRTGLPQLALPTTYAGSEATPVLGQTEAGRKTTLTDPAIQPGAIVYDPELVAGLPVAMTVTSGLNAMAHAVEGLYAATATPLSRTLCMAGLEAFATGLPAAAAAPADLDAREKTLFGAWACGAVLGQGGMALHHKLCHTLGGTLTLPHAETHAILLPHAAAFNETAAPEALRPLAALLGAASAGAGLHAFASRLGAPTALRDLGVAEADLDRIAAMAVETPYPNPRPLERAALRALLQDAWAGHEPGASA